MRPLHYSINVTVDGCVDHRAGTGDQAIHRHATANIARADAIILGRITYQMMEEAWRLDTRTMQMPSWTDPFARTIDAAKKYVVSSTLERVEWNSELIRGNVVEAVRHLKEQPGGELALGGVTLPLALAEAGLIDEYEFVVHPRLAGHGPYLLAGLSKYVDLKLVGQQERGNGAIAMRYVNRKS